MNSSVIYVVDSKGEVRITKEFLAGQAARAKVNAAAHQARETVGEAASYVYDNGTKLASQAGDTVAEVARKAYDFGRGFFS